MAGLEGMSALDRIKAIQKNQSLNLQNPYGLRSQPVVNPTTTVAPTNDYFMQNANTAVTPYNITPSQTVLPEWFQQQDWQGLSTTPNSTSPSWFTQNKDAISGAAQGLQALSGLANAYMGYKNYGLAKDMFGFQKAATNANYINAARDYNTQLQNAGEVGMALAGDTMDANARAARQAQLDSRKVSESAIG